MVMNSFGFGLRLRDCWGRISPK